MAKFYAVVQWSSTLSTEFRWFLTEVSMMVQLLCTAVQWFSSLCDDVPLCVSIFHGGCPWHPITCSWFSVIFHDYFLSADDVSMIAPWFSMSVQWFANGCAIVQWFSTRVQRMLRCVHIVLWTSMICQWFSGDIQWWLNDCQQLFDVVWRFVCCLMLSTCVIVFHRF